MSDNKKVAEVTAQIKVSLTQEDVDNIMCAALGYIIYWCREAEVVDGEYLGEYASEQISRGGVLRLWDADDMNTHWDLTLE